ncbi:MAG: hypothetical protein ACPHCI_00930 [Solirubrobacterales bacterium]
MSSNDSHSSRVRLPDDRLIAAHRNAVEAKAIEGADSLRIAAAEIVREGYLLHYGVSRYYDFDDDDLALLAADRMYASGLDLLARASDTEAVGMLATLIAGCAEAHAVGESARADELWASTLAMLAPGSDADGPV